MKKIVLLGLFCLIGSAVHADVKYPNQSKVPNLECTLSGDESGKFTLWAPQMVWQEQVNAKYPGYNLFLGESTYYGFIGVTVRYSDSSEGKYAQIIVKGGGRTNFLNTSTLKVSKFWDTFVSISLISTDESPIAYELRCVPGTPRTIE